MKSKKTKLILASTSPRRKMLLEMLGCDFEIIPSKTEEKINKSLSPVENVKNLAALKALDVASRVSDGIIIAADSLVVLNKKILGKPKDNNEAKKMLKSLGGKEHEAMTGIAVIDLKKGKMFQDAAITRIKFRKLNERIINDYMKKENLLDKAGAYAIQGRASLLIESIRGDYFNVVGLPLNKLNGLLEKLNVTLL